MRQATAILTEGLALDKGFNTGLDITLLCSTSGFLPLTDRSP